MDKIVLKNQIKNLVNEGIKNKKLENINENHIPILIQIASNMNLYEKSTQNYSELIFVAAPTGAGKDTLVRKITSNSKDKKYEILNMDMFRHYYSIIGDIPINDKCFAKLTNEISYEIYYLMEELILNYYPKTNVILTGTMKDRPWIEEILRKYKKHNYKVSLFALAVPYFESAISIFERYLNLVKVELEAKDHSPIRYTTLEYHDGTFYSFYDNLHYFEVSLNNNPGEVLDEILVYKRDKNVIDLSEDTLIYPSLDNNSLSASETVKIIIEKKAEFDSLRISKLSNIIEKESEYLIQQNVYEEIIESIKQICSLRIKNFRYVRKFFLLRKTIFLYPFLIFSFFLFQKSILLF